MKKYLLYLFSSYSLCFATTNLTTKITLLSPSTLPIAACAQSIERIGLPNCGEEIYNGTANITDYNIHASDLMAGVKFKGQDYKLRGSCTQYNTQIMRDFGYDHLYVFFIFTHSGSGDVTFTADAIVDPSGGPSGLELITLSNCHNT